MGLGESFGGDKSRFVSILKNFSHRHPRVYDAYENLTNSISEKQNNFSLAVKMLWFEHSVVQEKLNQEDRIIVGHMKKSLESFQFPALSEDDKKYLIDIMERTYQAEATNLLVSEQKDQEEVLEGAFGFFKTEYKGFMKQYSVFMDQGKKIPKNQMMVFMADLEMCSNSLMIAARNAFDEGLNAKQAGYMRFALENLEHLDKESFRRFVPKEFFDQLDKIVGDDYKKQPAGLHPSNGLDFHVDLDI